MAKFRNCSADERLVGYGLPGTTWVAPDGTVDVDDDAAAAYRCQPEIWAEVTPVSASPQLAPTPAPQPAEPAPTTGEVTQ